MSVEETSIEEILHEILECDYKTRLDRLKQWCLIKDDEYDLHKIALLFYTISHNNKYKNKFVNIYYVFQAFCGNKSNVIDKYMVDFCKGKIWTVAYSVNHITDIYYNWLYGRDNVRTINSIESASECLCNEINSINEKIRYYKPYLQIEEIIKRIIDYKKFVKTEDEITEIMNLLDITRDEYNLIDVDYLNYIIKHNNKKLLEKYAIKKAGKTAKQAAIGFIVALSNTAENLNAEDVVVSRKNIDSVMDYPGIGDYL